MYSRLGRAHRELPLALGVITLISIVLLFAWDAGAKLFSVQMHAALEAFSLAGIAVAYLLYQSALRPRPAERIKAIMLVAAFLFWAANQVWPDPTQALALNDVAIALFVLDAFLVMAGWPKTSHDESLAEAHAQVEDQCLSGNWLAGIVRRPESTSRWESATAGRNHGNSFLGHSRFHFVEYSPDRVEKRRSLIWLLDDCRSSCWVMRHGTSFCSITGNENESNIWAILHDALCQLDPSHSWHYHVCNQEVDNSGVVFGNL